MTEAPNASLMISVGNDISITTTERNLAISSDSTAAPRKNGSCIVCKQETDWNEATQKYERFCKNPECKAKYREKSEGNEDTDVGGNAGINCGTKIKSTNG